MSRIGLLIIATNKYKIFIDDLINSADEYFLKGHDVTYYIFTDDDDYIGSSNSGRKIIFKEVEHRDWPWMTLGRYKIFSSHKDLFDDIDYLYYCDVDMKFVGPFGDEILSDLVATQHPGYYGDRGTPETNPLSLAYVSPYEKMEYFAGGFNGGSKMEFLKMSDYIYKNIDRDYDNNIIAIWHDESHLNKYMADNKPTKILDPSYCYGETMVLPFDRKLLALDKNDWCFKKD